MKVEVLYFEGCPSHEALLPRLRTVLAETGTASEVETRRIESPEAAEAERFLGSPTVRVDGADVEPGTERREDFGLKCRLFRTRERTSPVSPDKWIRSALERAAAG